MRLGRMSRSQAPSLFHFCSSLSLSSRLQYHVFAFRNHFLLAFAFNPLSLSLSLSLQSRILRHFRISDLFLSTLTTSKASIFRSSSTSRGTLVGIACRTAGVRTMSASFDEEDAFEHTLLVVREVSVYKIPPRSSSGGYKCGEWLQSDKIWTGRLRVVSCGDRCEIRLEDPGSGELFAACFVRPGMRESSVETVLDSSRYFVLKIEDGQGKHAFIGLGFNERNEAFDFNVALSDHEKYVKRDQEKETAEESEDNHIVIHPAVNHRLKDGETIRINVKNKPATGGGMLSAAGLSGGGSSKQKVTTILAPPPGATGKLRTPLPPPPNDNAAARMTSGQAGLNAPKDSRRHHVDPFSDLSSIERSLPSTTGSGSTKSTASGWAAF